MLALMWAAKPPPVDVSMHLAPATSALWLLLLLVMVFFAVRPELWRRLWFARVDARPAGLLRIAFGVVVLWTVVDLLPLAKFLFTDEGLFLSKMARRNYSGPLATLWDPEHGFEHWYDLPRAVWWRFSLFHVRNDPAFVYAVFAAAIAALMLMIAGIKTRLTTVASWFLVNTIYTYNPIFYSGGDTVIRVFLFLGVLTNWGAAYSLDAWWRHKREVVAGAVHLPAPAQIAAWPLRLMMLQLTIIYCATGALKSGYTWTDGTALFFALNLDHFYRHPLQIHAITVFQAIGALPLATWVTRLWETVFPLALIGAALRAFERETLAGIWPKAATWRRLVGYACLAGALLTAAYLAGLTAFYYLRTKLGAWTIDGVQAAVIVSSVVVAVPVAAVAGYVALRHWRPGGHRILLEWVLAKRVWLGIGVLMHVGIDVLMNVGTFSQVMIAVYLAWLSGPEVERGWQVLLSQPLPATARPPRPTVWQRWLLAPIDRLRYRAPRPAYRVHHHPDATSIRQAALLRLWDVGGRLEFVADPQIPRATLAVARPGQPVVVGPAAGRALIAVLPGFWWLYPWCLVPGLSRVCGRLVARSFRVPLA